MRMSTAFAATALVALLVIPAAHGQQWQFLSGTATDSIYQFFNVHFTSTQTGVTSAYVNAPGGHSFPAIYRSMDGGKTWERVWQADSGQLGRLSFVDSLHGWATASVPADGFRYERSAILKTLDGGRSWDMVTSCIVGASGDTMVGTPDISFVSATTGWLVSYVYLSGSYLHHIFKTIDGGIAWIEQTDIDRSALAADTLFGGYPARTYFRDALNGIAFFDSTVLSTSDGGQHWGARRLRFNAGISTMQFFGGDTGVVLTGGLTIYRTNDLGQSWTPTALPYRGEVLPSAPFASFLDPDSAWLVGWDTCKIPHILCLSCPPCNEWGCSMCCEVYGCDDHFHGAYRSIRTTTNGGATWQEQFVLPDTNAFGEYTSLRSIFALDNSHVWAVGANGDVAIYSSSAAVSPRGGRAGAGLPLLTVSLCGRILSIAARTACGATVRLYDLRGRQVWAAANLGLAPGVNSVAFPVLLAGPGRYVLGLETQGNSYRTTVFVQR